MQIDALLRPLYVWLIKNKNHIVKIFFVFDIILMVFYLTGFFLFKFFPGNFSLFLELGGKFGTISVLFYVLTLLPGILKRLQILPIVQVSLMLFRRQFGILMFLLAINHSGYSLLFPNLALMGALPLKLSTREILGTIAEFVLFPLFITSNDLSVRKLGKWWSTIHKLTYVALLFIFGHIVLLGGELSVKILTGGLILAELLSWFVYWWRLKANALISTIQ